jgi:rhamnosyltransferase subunit B
MARVVLNPFGSFGDLHPFLAIAIQLRQRGHEAVVATSEVYREKVLREGVEFAAVRPDLGELAADEELIRRIWDTRRGTEHLLREVLVPYARAGFEDVSRAAAGADLLLTHTASYGGPIAAERLKLRWLSVVLQPMAFLSAYDPPVLAPAPWLRHLRPLGPGLFRLLRTFAERRLDEWMRDVAALRRDLGLPKRANPALDGQFSPWGTVALFSRYYAYPQPDWPEQVTLSGFVYYDQLGGGAGRYATAALAEADEKLARFLEEGDSPIVFTLGSSAVMQAGNFFDESMQAARQLGRRAVLLTGPQPQQRLRGLLPASIFVAEYAPYSSLLPRAAATVHQGGIGTTAQALRAGRPMLVVPWAHDQPDNAERVRRLGVARVVNRTSYNAKRAARELHPLLHGAPYTQAAARMRERLLQEDGITSAADAVEKALALPAPAPSNSKLTRR